MKDTPEKNVVRNFYETVWNAGNLAAVRDFVAPEATVHVPPFPDGVGSEGVAQLIGLFRSALPDLTTRSNILFGEGDRIMQQFTLTGTHTGTDLLGVPQRGQSVTVTGVGSFRVSNGVIVEYHGLIDIPALMQQL